MTLDRDGDGVVSNGGELFGDATLLLDGSEAPHGFVALAELDGPPWGGDGDGAIDAGDGAFGDLRVWFDRDHDGTSDPGELSTLHDLEIVRIGLDVVESGRRDRHGNRLRYTGKAWIEHRKGVTEQPIACSDVFFQLEVD